MSRFKTVLGVFVVLIALSSNAFATGGDYNHGWSFHTFSQNWKSNTRQFKANLHSFFQKIKKRQFRPFIWTKPNPRDGGNGGSHSVPELDASSGLIALSLTLGFVGLTRERKKRKLQADKA